VRCQTVVHQESKGLDKDREDSKLEEEKVDEEAVDAKNDAMTSKAVAVQRTVIEFFALSGVLIFLASSETELSIALLCLWVPSCFFYKFRFCLCMFAFSYSASRYLCT
jgi:hypothetical protein